MRRVPSGGRSARYAASATTRRRRRGAPQSWKPKPAVSRTSSPAASGVDRAAAESSSPSRGSRGRPGSSHRTDGPDRLAPISLLQGRQTRGDGAPNAVALDDGGRSSAVDRPPPVVGELGGARVTASQRADSGL